MRYHKFEFVQAKIQDSTQLALTIDRWKIMRETVVFTNGCFDILHKGHVSYLAKAASLGNRLIIALNTDESVRRQGKAKDRPINDEQARALVLASLGFVDGVVLFSEDTPLRMIELLQPDILVKGADYDPEEKDPTSKKYIVGRETIIGLGGTVKTIELEVGFSTTALIGKIKS